MTEAEESRLQPRLWLIGTALAAGIGLALVFAGVPDDASSLSGPGEGTAVFVLVGATQMGIGWLLVRGGEKPRKSILGDFLLNEMRLAGRESDPKPLMWMFAWGLLAMGAFHITVALVDGAAIEFSRVSFP